MKKKKTIKGKKNGNYGYRHSKLYPSPKLRNKLCELGIPRYEHNLAELGEMLPRMIKIESIINGKEIKGIFKLHFYKNDYEWLLSYKEWHGKKCIKIIIAKTEANVRAKCLIYLIENKIIKN